MVATPGSLAHAVRVDLKRLHETWMELVFPRQRGADETVLGKWKPSTASGKVGYRIWSALGMVALAVLYPLAVLGFATRYYARRLDGAATRLGLAGVVVLTAVVWGALTAVARYRLESRGFLAVGAASVVATVSAALSVVFSRVGGRATTILVAYPFAVTAVFLPPVVAAFYSPTLADLIFPQSESIAAWFLDNVLTVGDLNDYLRTQYDLTGVGYVAMWFGISIPVGWLLGGMVTLANLVRPTAE